MPRNFPMRKKVLLLGLVSCMTFVSPLGSNMFAPGGGLMAREFHNINVLLNSFCVTWQIGCALAPNVWSLVLFRFLSGLGGSGCLALGAGVISDLFHTEQLGIAMAVYSLGPLFGPVVRPVCGGFIAQGAGWRWVFWVLLIVSTPLAIGTEVLNSETNHLVLIRRKVAHMNKEPNRSDLQSCYEEDIPLATSIRHVLRHGITRPMKLLFKSPIVFILAAFISLAYDLLYLFFTTIASVFTETYGWAVEICGLAFLGLAIGFFVGVAVVAVTSDKTVFQLTKRNGGVFVPEMRLPSLVFCSCFIPISFFWHGWAAEELTHWIVPIIDMVPFGFGMMGVFIPIQTYIVDCFPMYAASASAALTATRSISGALLPLVGPSMYTTLGLGWGNSLLGFTALLLPPVTRLLYKYGGMIRTRYPVKL